MFVFRFKIKNENNPKGLQHNTEAVLGVAKKMLEDLKGGYKDTGTPMKNLALITILGDGIHRGLNTGAYDLSDPDQSILDTLYSMLVNFLKSRQDININSNFSVNVKVLSLEHLRSLIARGRVKMDNYYKRPKVG